MEYLLAGHIVFNESSRTLVSKNQEIQLSVVTSRLLSAIIAAGNNKISRIELLDSVWEQHGLVASDHNLNRSISLLRKSFQKLEPSEVIETIPKQGFIMHCSISPLYVEEVPSPPLVEIPGTSTRYLYISLLVLFIMMMGTLAIYLYYYNTSDAMHKYKSFEMCDIYYDGDMVKPQNIDNFFNNEQGMKIKELCKNSAKKIYFDDNKVAMSSQTYATHIAVCNNDNERPQHECENYIYVNIY